MALTAVVIRNAKGRVKPYKLSDSDGRIFSFRRTGGLLEDELSLCRRKKCAVVRRLSDTGLAEAREQRDAARKVLARGEDPSERVKLDRFAVTVAASNSFKAVADE